MVLSVPASAIAPYLTDGILEPLGPDRCRLTRGAWSWAGLAASFAAADADLEVVGPPELAQAFADLARRAADAAVSHAQASTAARDAQPASAEDLTKCPVCGTYVARGAPRCGRAACPAALHG